MAATLSCMRLDGSAFPMVNQAGPPEIPIRSGVLSSTADLSASPCIVDWHGDLPANPKPTTQTRAGAPPERLCTPLVEAFQAKGGELHYNARLKKILVGEDNGAAGFQLADGRVIEGDLYVSAASGVHPGRHIPNPTHFSPRVYCSR